MFSYENVESPKRVELSPKGNTGSDVIAERDTSGLVTEGTAESTESLQGGGTQEAVAGVPLNKVLDLCAVNKAIEKSQQEATNVDKEKEAQAQPSKSMEEKSKQEGTRSGRVRKIRKPFEFQDGPQLMPSKKTKEKRPKENVDQGSKGATKTSFIDDDDDEVDDLDLDINSDFDCDLDYLALYSSRKLHKVSEFSTENTDLKKKKRHEQRANFNSLCGPGGVVSKSQHDKTKKPQVKMLNHKSKSEGMQHRARKKRELFEFSSEPQLETKEMKEKKKQQHLEAKETKQKKKQHQKNAIRVFEVRMDSEHSAELEKSQHGRARKKRQFFEFSDEPQLMTKDLKARLKEYGSLKVEEPNQKLKQGSSQQLNAKQKLKKKSSSQMGEPKAKPKLKKQSSSQMGELKAKQKLKKQSSSQMGEPKAKQKLKKQSSSLMGEPNAKQKLKKQSSSLMGEPNAKQKLKKQNSSLQGVVKANELTSQESTQKQEAKALSKKRKHSESTSENKTKRQKLGGESKLPMAKVDVTISDNGSGSTLPGKDEGKEGKVGSHAEASRGFESMDALGPASTSDSRTSAGQRVRKKRVLFEFRDEPQFETKELKEKKRLEAKLNESTNRALVPRANLSQHTYSMDTKEQSIESSSSDSQMIKTVANPSEVPNVDFPDNRHEIEYLDDGARREKRVRKPASRFQFTDEPQWETKELKEKRRLEALMKQGLLPEVSDTGSVDKLDKTFEESIKSTQVKAKQKKNKDNKLYENGAQPKHAKKLVAAKTHDGPAQGGLESNDAIKSKKADAVFGVLASQNKRIAELETNIKALKRQLREEKAKCEVVKKSHEPMLKRHLENLSILEDSLVSRERYLEERERRIDLSELKLKRREEQILLATSRLAEANKRSSVYSVETPPNEVASATSTVSRIKTHRIHPDPMSGREGSSKT